MEIKCFTDCLPVPKVRPIDRNVWAQGHSTALTLFTRLLFNHWSAHKNLFGSLCSIIFGVFFVLNLFLWGSRSSAAIPFTTLVALLALWFGISVPLTFVGAYFGFKKRVSFASCEKTINVRQNAGRTKHVATHKFRNSHRNFVFVGCSPSSTQCERTKSRGRSRIRRSTRSRSPASSWAEFCLSDASLFSSFSS